MLTEIYRQFMQVGIEYERGNILDLEFALNQPELRGIILLVHGVLRFDEHSDYDYDTQYANEDQERGFECVGEPTDPEFRNPPYADGDTDEAEHDNRIREREHRRGEFVFEAFDLLLLLFLHSPIIARCKRKSNRKSKQSDGKK